MVACRDSDRDGYGDGCELGPDCDDFNHEVPGPERCNGEDDDCDFDVDEDFPLGDACDVPGGCAGRIECAAGEAVCRAQAADRCNGEDDDCDGEIDEGARNSVRCLTELYGQCIGGRMRCEDGAARCVPETEPGVEEEICDGRDQDCDGVVDEDVEPPRCYPGPDGTEGVGECVAGGRRCDAGRHVTCVGARTPLAERCDGLDDDCDGRVDEKLGCGCALGARRVCLPRAPAIGGHGACRAGEQRCIDGQWGPCEGRIDPEPEICDGLDNDCDGLLDERAIGVDTACRAGRGRCAAGGLFVCEGGHLRCDAQLRPPDQERCGDQVDVDCNGVAGVSPAVGMPCMTPGQVDGLIICERDTSDFGDGRLYTTCVESL